MSGDDLPVDLLTYGHLDLSTCARSLPPTQKDTASVMFEQEVRQERREQREQREGYLEQSSKLLRLRSQSLRSYDYSLTPLSTLITHLPCVRGCHLKPTLPGTQPKPKPNHRDLLFPSLQIQTSQSIPLHILLFVFPAHCHYLCHRHRQTRR